MVRNAEFVEKQLTGNILGKRAQNGFDLSLKEVKFLGGIGTVHKDKTDVVDYFLLPVAEDGYYYLAKGVYSISFNEGVRVPQGHCGMIKTRSSLVRNGCIIDSGWYDTAFEVSGAGAMLFVYGEAIKIAQDARVAQLILFEAEETTDYNGQWQNELDRK
jgi:dUTP pyrophosphatase